MLDKFCIDFISRIRRLTTKRSLYRVRINFQIVLISYPMTTNLKALPELI